MCMVSGGSDILFEVLNAGGEIGKNWEGWIFLGVSFIVLNLPLVSGIHLFSALMA